MKIYFATHATTTDNESKIAFGDKYPVIADKRLRELNYGDFNGKPSEVVEPMKKVAKKAVFW